MNKPLEYYLEGGYVVEDVIEEGRDGCTYVARLKAMPGCLGQGASPAEARTNLDQVRDAYIRSRFERGVEIAEPDYDRGVVSAISQTISGDGGAASVWEPQSSSGLTQVNRQFAVAM